MTLLRHAGLAAAVLLVGCGGPTPTARPEASDGVGRSAEPAPSTAPPKPVADVCALAPDMAGIIGREPVAPPSSYTVGPAERCLWVYGRDPSRFVGVTVGGAATHEVTVATLGAGQAVEGVGDEASWWPNNRTLSVRAGARAFQVDLQLERGEVRPEVAVSIAEQILRRLP